jgi:dTMP kinase
VRLPNIVAIEGIDGAGKDTQAKMLADYIDDQPRPTLEEAFAKKCLRGCLPDPECDLTYPLIRQMLAGRLRLTGDNSAEPRMQSEMAHGIALQAVMLMNHIEAAARWEQACLAGRTVVLSRYWDSAVAYGAADGLDRRWLERCLARLPKAHHVLIDIPVDESFTRRPKRDDVYEASIDRLREARIEYLALYERHGVDASVWGHADRCEKYLLSSEYRSSASGWSVVNGLGTADQVHARIRAALEL